MEGWIKIHRKFETWEWRAKPEMVSLFLHMLTCANYSAAPWQGIVIERGQSVFGRQEWAKKLGISEQKLRTCIERLKSTNEITIESTNRFTIITIVNYEEYQKDETEITNEKEKNQQTNNQQLTTSKEEKEYKKVSKYIGDSEKVENYFTDWYEQYPRKDGSKTTARKRYISALESGATARELWDGLQNYIAHCEGNRTEKKYIAHAATFLHQRRWEAEYGDDGFEHRDPYAVKCL